MADRTHLLDIRGLRIEARIGDAWTEIVRGVDLRLNRGEVMGLVGESGAGKSTIGLAAAAYVRDGCRISAGEVNFDGVDLIPLSEAKRRSFRGKHIAYVAQSAAASFNPAYRLIDQYCEMPIRHRLMTYEKAKQDAVRLYEDVLLPDPHGFGFRFPHQVSGGQLQRAMLAMAMACRPELIIFDEPTTALDVTTQIEVLAVIKGIVERFGTAAIYITHDLAVVAQMADRIKVVLRGSEVEEAPSREMLSSPKQAYTKSLWAVRVYQRDVRPPPSPQAIPVVSVRSVSATYGNVQVLSDVSFDIYRKRTLAVVGESGSGKTTIARAIAGLMPQSSGTILFNGEPLPQGFADRARATRRNIQMIYQMADTALNPKQRIGEILGWPVQFFLGLTGKACRERVADLLRLIDLEPRDFIHRRPSELSGGQRQRVGIARAIAAEPAVVICDEVTSALDQLVAEGILKLLEQLQDKLDLTYMFITHDLATVRAIADDVVVMRAGRVVEHGARQQVLDAPRDAYTRTLLASVPEMDPDWLAKLRAARL